MAHKQRTPQQELHARHMSNFAISVQDRTIGPAHDPYGETMVGCTNLRSMWSFTQVENGLGMSRLTITDPDGERHSHWEVWQADDAGEHMRFRDEECRRLVGCTPKEAHEWYLETYQPDPMSEHYKGWR